MQSYHGGFGFGATAGPIPISAPGFASKVTLFDSDFGSSLTGVWGNAIVVGSGPSADLLARNVQISEQHNQVTANARRNANPNALAYWSVGGVELDRMDYAGSTPTGFDVDVVLASGTDRWVEYDALGGAELQTAVVEFSTGDLMINVGFEPVAARFWSVDLGAPQANDLDSVMTHGAAASGAQWAATGCAMHGTSTKVTSSLFRNDACLVTLDAMLRSELNRAVVTGFTPTGLTLDWPLATRAATHYAMLIGGVSAHCSIRTQPAADTTQLIPVGLVPKWAASGSTSSTTPNQVELGYMMSYGSVCENGSQAAMAVASRDGAGNSFARRWHGPAFAITNTHEAITTGTAVASFVNNSLQLNWSGITGGGGREFGILALGDPVVVPPAVGAGPVARMARRRRGRDLQEMRVRT